MWIINILEDMRRRFRGHCLSLSILDWEQCGKKSRQNKMLTKAPKDRIIASRGRDAQPSGELKGLSCRKLFLVTDS